LDGKPIGKTKTVVKVEPSASRSKKAKEVVPLKMGPPKAAAKARTQVRTSKAANVTAGPSPQVGKAALLVPQNLPVPLSALEMGELFDILTSKLVSCSAVFIFTMPSLTISLLDAPNVSSLYFAPSTGMHTSWRWRAMRGMFPQPPRPLFLLALPIQMRFNEC